MKQSVTRIGLLLTAVLAHQVAAESEITVSPVASVEGKSQADWSREWWQWAGSFGMADSPIADRTGALCGSKQSGSVWFLAGTYGTKRTVRTCIVPTGKYIFFPLIIYVVMPSTNPPATCDDVTAKAAQMTNNPEALILDVDGTRIRDLTVYRQRTTNCFDMGLRTDSATRVYPSAANGYYVMLRPMSQGKHTLNFGGALPSMLQAVTYTLEVQ